MRGAGRVAATVSRSKRVEVGDVFGVLAAAELVDELVVGVFAQTECGGGGHRELVR